MTKNEYRDDAGVMARRNCEWVALSNARQTASFGRLDEGHWRRRVVSRRTRVWIVVRSCSSDRFRGSKLMGLERMGPAGSIRLLFILFRD